MKKYIWIPDKKEDDTSQKELSTPRSLYWWLNNTDIEEDELDQLSDLKLGDSIWSNAAGGTWKRIE